MVKLLIAEHNINETTLNDLSTLEGGPLGTTVQDDGLYTITASSTSFSYVVRSLVGEAIKATVIQGEGEDLVYDAQNRPIGGTITSIGGFEVIDITADVPIYVDNYYLTDISIDASAILNGTLGDFVFGGDNEIEIEIYNEVGLTGASSVSTATGDDNITVSVIDGEDFASNSGINIDSGAGSDTITLSPNFGIGAKSTITTGEGNDTIVIEFDKAETVAFTLDQLEAVPTQTITDFNVSNDKITLTTLTPEDGWQWQATDVNGSAEIRAQKLDTDGQPTGEIGTRIIVDNVMASELNLDLSTTPTPSGPIFGTDLGEAMFGDAGDNILIGLGGDDALFGFAGNDVLIGGDGNDSMDAGDGNDQLFGEFGDDTLFGGAGDDALFGGLGNDYLVGDADGTSGVDGIFGEEGNDIAFGGLGADYIDGGTGDDSLYGETGADKILGGDGNDFIDGGTENDIINGGEGNDILLGGLGDDEIRGEDGDDSILGQEGNDFIFGGLGNDTIDGGSGDDQIDGGDGDDTIFDAEGNNTFFGGNGNNSIFAGSGDDKFFGGNDNDVLFGGEGNDYFNTGLGIDVVNGGAGADNVRLGADAGQIFWQDFENGVDKISFDGIVTTTDFANDVSISATTDGNSTLIAYGQTQLFLENVNASLIDEQDFFLVSFADSDALV